MTYLYHGSNDAHEFWESEDSRFLILRNHQETVWTAHEHHCFRFGAASVEDAAAQLGCALSSEKVWTRKRTRFRLVPAPDWNSGLVPVLPSFSPRHYSHRAFSFVSVEGARLTYDDGFICVPQDWKPRMVGASHS